MGTNPEIEPAGGGLNDPQFSVRLETVQRLRASGWTPEKPAERALAAIVDIDYASAAAEGEPALEPLGVVLGTGSWVDARKAAAAIGQIGGPAAAALLAKALKGSEDFDVLRTAAAALGKCGPSGIEVLKLNLDHRNSKLRTYIIRALGDSGQPAAVEALLGVLGTKQFSDYRDLRPEAARALGKTGGARVLTRLVETYVSLPEADVSPRGAISAVLIEAGRKAGETVDELVAVLRRLQQAEGHQPPDRVEAVIRILTVLGGIGDLRATPVLTEALESPEAGVRRSAARALARLPDRAAVPLLIKALRDEDADVQQEAASSLGALRDAGAVPALVEALKVGNPSQRYSAAGALGRIGDSGAVAALVGALSDSDPDVRGEAAEALGQLGGPEADRALNAALDDPSGAVRAEAIRALSTAGGCPVEVFSRMLADPEARVRSSAIRVLAAMGAREPVPDIVKLLQDPDGNTRNAAIDALARLQDQRAIVPLIAALGDKEWWVSRTARNALESLTGRHHGYDRAAWEAWSRTLAGEGAGPTPPP